MVGGNPRGTILKPRNHHSVYDITIFQPWLKNSVDLEKPRKKPIKHCRKLGGWGFDCQFSSKRQLISETTCHGHPGPRSIWFLTGKSQNKAFCLSPKYWKIYLVWLLLGDITQSFDTKTHLLTPEFWETDGAFEQSQNYHGERGVRYIHWPLTNTWLEASKPYIYKTYLQCMDVGGFSLDVNIAESNGLSLGCPLAMHSWENKKKSAETVLLKK